MKGVKFQLPLNCSAVFSFYRSIISLMSFSFNLSLLLFQCNIRFCQAQLYCIIYRLRDVCATNLYNEAEGSKAPSICIYKSERSWESVGLFAPLLPLIFLFFLTLERFVLFPFFLFADKLSAHDVNVELCYFWT